LLQNRTAIWIVSSRVWKPDGRYLI